MEENEVNLKENKLLMEYSLKEKTNEPKTKLKPDVNTFTNLQINGSLSNDKKINVNFGINKETDGNNKKVLNKIDLNGNERKLSENESYFETVSSASSKTDLDLFLSSENEDFNGVAQIKNELALRQLREKNQRRWYSWLPDYNYSDSLDKSNSKGKSGHYSNESSRLRCDRYKIDGKPKQSLRKRRYDERRCEERKSWCFKKSKGSSGREKDDRDSHKHKNSYDRELRRSRNFSYSRSRRSRRSRSSERISRSRSPTHRDSRSGRKEEKRNFDNYQDSPKYRSKFRKSYPRNETKIRSDVKRDVPEVFLSSGSEDSRINKRYPVRQRSRWHYNKYDSPSTIIARGIQRQKSTQFHNDLENNRRFDKSNYQNRKKEGTPLVDELEEQPKGAELTNKFVEVKKVQTCAASISETPAPPPRHRTPPPQPISNPVVHFPAPVVLRNVVYPPIHAPFPPLSTDKLPLTPGPAGLPIHTTVTGEQILHDLDGKRIPVGPNGYYLPLDPTGRLFPHILFPGNVAVPIHMTDDGVIRLPNSEPVPFGPPHQLPVNVDGRIIPLDPNSRPLYSCQNIPKHPPLQFLQEYTAVKRHFGVSPGINSPENASLQKNINPSDLVKGFAPEINKTEYLKKYKKTAIQKRQGVLRCIEIQTTLNLSEGESTLLKLQEKEIAKSEESRLNDSDMVLGSSDSDPSFVSKLTRQTGGSGTRKKTLSADEEGALQTVCDDLKNENSEVSQLETKDPIVKKIQQAFESLVEKNFQPPSSGRFILSNPFRGDSFKVKPQYESPLLRNRIKLPFITTPFPQNRSGKVEEPSHKITSGLFQGKENGVLEKPFGFRHDGPEGEINPEKKSPSVLTFDFGMQCDFTSEAIRGLNEKVDRATREIVRLKKVNANLLEEFSQVQTD